MAEEEHKAKRPRAEGTMPPELRDKIWRELEAIGQVEHKRRSHKKRGPVRPHCLPAEDLVHVQAETVRQGQNNRIHYRCSNEKCGLVRNDKWDTHVIKASYIAHTNNTI